MRTANIYGMVMMKDIQFKRLSQIKNNYVVIWLYTIILARVVFDIVHIYTLSIHNFFWDYAAQLIGLTLLYYDA